MIGERIMALPHFCIYSYFFRGKYKNVAELVINDLTPKTRQN